MPDKIEVNQGYILTPTVKGQPRKLAYVCGRQGQRITLMMVNGLNVTDVTADYGREFGHVCTSDGVYNLSAIGKVVDLATAAEICQIITQCPEV